jgi:hypothetical protein
MRFPWATLFLVVVLRLDNVHAQKNCPLRCYSNGDGVGPPTADTKQVCCPGGSNEGWMCVAKNYYGDSNAALWPIDTYGEKCYRYCAKLTICDSNDVCDNRWAMDYVDDEGNVQRYSMDTGIALTTACYSSSLCNQQCMDEDSAVSTRPLLLLMLGSFLGVTGLMSWF